MFFTLWREGRKSRINWSGERAKSTIDYVLCLPSEEGKRGESTSQNLPSHGGKEKGEKESTGQNLPSLGGRGKGKEQNQLARKRAKSTVDYVLCPLEKGEKKQNQQFTMLEGESRIILTMP